MRWVRDGSGKTVLVFSYCGLEGMKTVCGGGYVSLVSVTAFVTFGTRNTRYIYVLKCS